MRKTISPVVLDPRPMEIGKIKIGGQGKGKKGKGGKPPPVKYDHFKVVTRQRGQADDENFLLDEGIHEAVGEKPTTLKVRLLGDTPEDNFFSRLVRYNGREKIWDCDGEVAINLENGEEVTCQRGESGECACKPYGRFSVILEDASTFGAVHVFRTTSWESIRNIQNALEVFYRNFGSLAGLPLLLVLYPAEVQFKGEGGQLRTGIAYKVGLVLRGTFEEARQIALTHHRQLGATRKEVRLLTAGLEAQLEELDRAEAGEIAEEFQLGTDVQEEEGEEEAGEEIDIHDLRKQYFGLIAELYDDPAEREDCRKALQFAHPELPESSTQWEHLHFVRAIGDIQQHGKALFTRAIRELAQEDPVSEEDLDILKNLIDVSGIGHDQAGRIWRVIGCGVSAWVQREIQKLKLGGLPTPIEETDSEEAEVEQTEAEISV